MRYRRLYRCALSDNHRVSCTEKRLVPHNFSFKERREELIRSDFRFPEGISFFSQFAFAGKRDGFLSRIKRILCTFSCVHDTTLVVI